MRQLDLFGSPPDKTTAPDMVKAPALPVPVADEKAGTKEAGFAFEQYSVYPLTSENKDPGTGVEAVKSGVDKKPTGAADKKVNSNIIFTDGKIGVKIKAKTTPVQETQALPAPVAKVAAPLLPKAKKEKKTIQKRGRKSFKEIDAEVDLIEVPGDEELFKKQYYPIRDVAKWFNVNTSLLRFWENEFDILKPRKNRKGDRMFRPEDVKNIHLIYQLLRQRKYSLEGAKEYLKTNRQEADTQLVLTQTLQKIKTFLLDLKANLA